MSYSDRFVKMAPVRSMDGFGTMSGYSWKEDFHLERQSVVPDGRPLAISYKPGKIDRVVGLGINADYSVRVIKSSQISSGPKKAYCLTHCPVCGPMKNQKDWGKCGICGDSINCRQCSLENSGQYCIPVSDSSNERYRRQPSPQREYRRQSSPQREYRRQSTPPREYRRQSRQSSQKMDANELVRMRFDELSRAR